LTGGWAGSHDHGVDAPSINGKVKDRTIAQVGAPRRKAVGVVGMALT
jgi:hypothetical protein